MGRHSEFTQEAADEICDRLAKGESLRKICEDEEGGFLPTARTVHRWLASDEEWAGGFRQQYVRAREAQADHYAEEVISISDGDPMADPDGVAVARDRLRVDARKWYAGKLAPKKYGDKVTNEHVGPDGGPVQVQKIERVIVDPK